MLPERDNRASSRTRARSRLVETTAERVYVVRYGGTLVVLSAKESCCVALTLGERPREDAASPPEEARHGHLGN